MAPFSDPHSPTVTKDWKKTNVSPCRWRSVIQVSRRAKLTSDFFFFFFSPNICYSLRASSVFMTSARTRPGCVWLRAPQAVCAKVISNFKKRDVKNEQMSEDFDDGFQRRSWCCARIWLLVRRLHWIFMAKNTAITSLFEVKLVATSSRRLDDITRAEWRLVLFLGFFYVGVHGHRQRPLGGILSLHQSPEQFSGSENATGASIDTRVSSKWVKYHFF